MQFIKSSHFCVLRVVHVAVAELTNPVVYTFFFFVFVLMLKLLGFQQRNITLWHIQTVNFLIVAFKSPWILNSPKFWNAPSKPWVKEIFSYNICHSIHFPSNHLSFLSLSLPIFSFFFLSLSSLSLPSKNGVCLNIFP